MNQPGWWSWSLPKNSAAARALRKRSDRDRIVAQDAVHYARRLGTPVINVDETRDANPITSIVASYFRRYLPAPHEGDQP